MDADSERPFPSVSIRVHPWFVFSIPDCGLRIADLTAKNAENTEKEFLFVLSVFFVDKEFSCD